MYELVSKCTHFEEVEEKLDCKLEWMNRGMKKVVGLNNAQICKLNEYQLKYTCEYKLWFHLFPHNRLIPHNWSSHNYGFIYIPKKDDAIVLNE